jgi:site-specific DNA recombinase
VDVPALITHEQWMTAQEILARHNRFSRRNALHDYLLHGLVYCGLPGCGFHCAGMSSHTGHAQSSSEVQPNVYYYICNGKRKAIQYYGRTGRRCQSVAVNADWLDGQVWSEVEAFVRNPGPLLLKLAARMQGQSDEADALRADLVTNQQEQESRQTEKDTVLALFRKGRISERDLDRQLDAIAQEEESCAKAISSVREWLAALEDVGVAISGAQALLERLRGKLGRGQVPYETRRELGQGTGGRHSRRR